MASEAGVFLVIQSDFKSDVGEIPEAKLVISVFYIIYILHLY